MLHRLRDSDFDGTEENSSEDTDNGLGEDDDFPDAERSSARNNALGSLTLALKYLGSAQLGLELVDKQAAADRLSRHLVALSLHLKTSILSPPKKAPVQHAGIEPKAVAKIIRTLTEGWRERLVLAVDLAIESARGQVWKEDVRELTRESDIILAPSQTDGSEPGEPARSRSRTTEKGRWACVSQ